MMSQRLIASDYIPPYSNWIDLARPGAVARSDARPPGMRTVAGSFITSGKMHSFVEIGHEKNSTTILSLPLIQEGQLSVTGGRMCTKYW